MPAQSPQMAFAGSLSPPRRHWRGQQQLETDMNSKIKGAMLAAAALVVTFSAGAGDGRRDRDYVAHLQGTWATVVLVRNCVSGDVVLGPFSGLSTFHQGGTQSETAAGSPSSRRGPGHGSWYRTGKHTFEGKFVFQRFDLNGFLIGTQEVTNQQEVAEGSMTATAVSKISLRDINGVQVGAACATAELRRL
jgi:hypothetical protein